MSQLETKPLAELEERLLFETLLVEISTHFINLPADQIDQSIEAAQRSICEYFRIDRSTIWQRSVQEPDRYVLTHLYQPEDVQPVIKPANFGFPSNGKWTMQASDGSPVYMLIEGKTYFPWLFGQVFQRGKTVIISKLDDLPPEASYDVEMLKRFETKSTAVIPLLVGGVVIGCITFARMQEAREWPQVMVSQFNLIAQIFANALSRKMSELELRESEARLSLAAASANAGMWGMSIDTGQVWATDKTRELFGFLPHEELHYESFLDVIHPEDSERVHQTIQQAMQTETDFNIEYRVLRADGSVRWIISRGQLQQTTPGERLSMMGVSVDISERKQVEDTLRRNEQNLSELTGRIIHTQEEELRRLSRELHDDLTQRLAALALDAALIEKQLNPVDPQAVQAIKAMRANLTDLADDVHDLSRQLHPSIIEDLGLVQAVQAECNTFSKKTGIDLSFMHPDLPDSIPQHQALCLYRIIQEGLQNIAKHSRATAASIILQGIPDGIRLLIQDKGIGFDLKRAKQNAGIGLSSMRERARHVNGTIAVASTPGKGTEIQIFIPLGKDHEQATAADS
jgi:PAS domain S-box-containing protein